ncbi:MAG TPA: glutaredoxin family protein [Steroidobacteraceae bacterium]|nr:glutaredoxin family protein [Steroidobacteraceae bacterium]
MKHTLTLLTRTGCELCEHMLQELSGLGAEWPLPPVTLKDVDEDPELQRRYGLRVPVLLLDGERVAEHRLDRSELKRLFRL